MSCRFISVALIFLLSLSSVARATQVEDVKFISHGVTLVGSVVLPTNKPIAALVLVHGSGPEERMMGLARALASDGLAVLTFDKRGVGKSGGEYWGIERNKENIAAVNLNLLADDAVAAAQALAKYPSLEGVPIGFVGISQAGWIIPIAASRFPMTKFLGLWSGPVCTVSEQLHFQSLAMDNQDFWKTHTRDQVAEYMQSVGYRADDIDPRTSLSKLSIPGLWLFGDEDNLVPVDLSVARLESLIQQRHSDFEYGVMPGYGHNIVDPAYSAMVSWIKRTITTVPASH